MSDTSTDEHPQPRPGDDPDLAEREDDVVDEDAPAEAAAPPEAEPPEAGVAPPAKLRASSESVNTEENCRHSSRETPARTARITGWARLGSERNMADGKG